MVYQKPEHPLISIVDYAKLNRPEEEKSGPPDFWLLLHFNEKGCGKNGFTGSSNMILMKGYCILWLPPDIESE